MSALVLDLKDAIVDNISLGKQQAYHINYELIPIYYTPDKTIKTSQQTLIVKTPRIFIPHSLYTRGNNQQYLEVVFLNEDNDPNGAFFKKWIKRVESRIVKILSRRKTIKLENKEFSSILKEDENYKASKIYLTIQSDKNECIDTNNKVIPLWEFTAPCYGFFVIQFKNIWVNATKWGINLYTQGAMVLPSQVNDPKQITIQHLFDDELKLYKPVIEHEDYEKYFRMLKMGVPLQAVRHKMSLANPALNSIVLTYNQDTLMINIPELNSASASSIPPSPPTPPMLFQLQNQKHSNNASSSSSNTNHNHNPEDIRKHLLGAISAGVQLKKVSDTPIVKKPLVNVRKDLMVPTLDEIRNALKNLKRNETL
jgi:hypothetical protein